MWPSICSPDAQLVPSIRFDNDLNPSTVASKSGAYPILIDLTVPDTTDQVLSDSYAPDYFSSNFEGSMMMQRIYS
jgi:hypothetical protein